MRTRRLHGLAFALSAAASLAACNLVLGIDNRDVPTGGHMGGASSSSSHAVVSSSGMVGTGGGDAGTGSGGDAAADADAAAPSRALWAASFGGKDGGASPTVNAIATWNGNVLLTGATNGLGMTDFGCTNPKMTETGAAYWLEVNAMGECVWVILFGGLGSQGTGLAIDPVAGNIVLAATFVGSATIPNGLPLTQSGSVQGTTDSFVAYYNALPTTGSPGLLWSHQIGDVSPNSGNQLITSAAVASGYVSIAGYYQGTLAVTDDMAHFPNVTTNSLGLDAFSYTFSSAAGGFIEGAQVTSTSTNDQIGNGVAVTDAGVAAMTGSTDGGTTFGSSTLTPLGDPNAFLASYTRFNLPTIQTVFSAPAAQSGKSVAFDSAGNIILGATFVGTFPSGDAGASFMGPGGQSVLVASYGNTMTVPCNGGTTFGSSTPGDVATLGGLALDGTDAVYFAGGFTGAAMFATHPSITASGSPDIYVAKLQSALGPMLWTEHYGTPGSQAAADAIAYDATTKAVFIAGHFTGNIDFGNGFKLDATTAAVFLAKLDAN